MGPVPPTEETVNALHVQKHGGGGWHVPRATGPTATPTVLASGLAETQMTRVMANILMPKYSGNPEELDEFERTWNKYVNDSTMECNEAQKQRFCLSMLPHCVPANVKEEFNDWAEDGKIPSWDEMWRTFGKEEVADLPHHVQRRFKVAEDVRRPHQAGRLAGLPPGIPPLEAVCQGLERGVKGRPVYSMLLYKWQENFQAKEQNRGR